MNRTDTFWSGRTSNTEYTVSVLTGGLRDLVVGKSPIVSAVSLCTWMTCTYTSSNMCRCREWRECAALSVEMIGRKTATYTH